MTTSSTNSKRIAMNTIFLCLRMVTLMGIGFFTSRVILHSLGIVDYGIVNVVGGLAMMFVFFRSSLANVTQRYLNMYLGKGDMEGARHTFCQHQTLYIIIAVVVVLFAETIGLWLVYNKLDIPLSRLHAAVWVFHLTVAGLFITILSVVYDSALMAHENMKIYSTVGIVEGCIKLLIAYILTITTTLDKLIVYQSLLLMVAAGLWTFYALYCKRKYTECSFKFYWNRHEVRNASEMVSWNTLSAVVWAFNEHGINVLLNIFFGPAVNAARGVSFTVSTTINNYGLNFHLSTQPQIVKAYANGDYARVWKLFFATSKYSIFLEWAMCLPVMLCTDALLNLWLKEVPEYASTFTQWVLAFYLVQTLSTPVWMLALAVGKLKRYVLTSSTIFFMAFPVSYLLLKMGLSPVSVFICLFVVRIIYYIAELMIVRLYIPLPMTAYFKQVILPILLVIITSGVLGLSTRMLFPSTLWATALIIVISVLITCSVIYTMGIDSNERFHVNSYIKKYLNLDKKK